MNLINNFFETKIHIQPWTRVMMFRQSVLADKQRYTRATENLRIWPVPSQVRCQVDRDRSSAAHNLIYTIQPRILLQIIWQILSSLKFHLKKKHCLKGYLNMHISISVPLQRGHYGNISDNHLCNLKIMTDNFLTPNRRWGGR